MSRRYFTLLPLLVLGAALAVLLYRILLGEVLYWGLPSLQFVPWRDYAVELMRNGELPLWNPYNGAGAPLFANYQSALLYPFTWPSFVLPVAWTMSLTSALHLFIAGAGTFVLLRRMGANTVGAGAAGIAFGMCGYLVARLGTFPMVSVAAWLPWLLWAVYGVMIDGKRYAIVWFTVFTAMLLLAGHAQLAWYSLTLAGLFALWLGFTQRPIRWKSWFMLAVAGAVGVGIAGLQLLATAELLGLSQRSEGVDFAFAMNFSFNPFRAFTFLNGNLFGTPADGSYATAGAYFEDAAYIGLIPLFGAIAAVWQWRSKRKIDPLAQTVIFWLLVAVVGFVFALGANTPIFPFLYEHVPSFDLFQAPVRWLLWTVMALCVLAGIGVTWWGRSARLKRWTKRLMAACVAAIMVGILGLLAGISGTNTLIPSLFRAILILGVVGLCAGLLTLLQPLPTSPKYLRWSGAVLVVIAVDLLVANWGLNLTTNASFYDRRPSQIQPSERGYWTAYAEEELKFGRYFMFDDYRPASEHIEELRQSNLPNLNLLDRASLFNNFDPLLPGDYVAYRELLEIYPDRQGLLQVAGVTDLVTGNGVTPLDNDASQAYWVSAVCWHEDDVSIVAALSQADFDPQMRVELAGEGECAAPQEVQQAEWNISADGSHFQIQSDAPGWLVIAQTYYPGWQALLDGETIPIERANLAFRAVAVPEGEHLLEFVYAPAWITPGAIITSVSLLCLVILFLWNRKSAAYNTEEPDHAG